MIFNDFLASLRELERHLGPSQRFLEQLARLIENHGPKYASDSEQRRALQAETAAMIGRVRDYHHMIGAKKEAAARIAEIMADPEPVFSVSTIATDPEVGRLSVALGKPGAFRLYLLALDMMRRRADGTQGQHSIEIQTLFEAQRAAGIGYARSTFYDHIKAGIGLYWRGRNNGWLYSFAQHKIAAKLTELAIAQDMPDLIEWDRPGARSCYIEIGGRLQEFEAQCYVAWLSLADPTISRKTLETLWNREKKALLAWEHLAGNVTVRSNYAQTVTPQDDRIPDHASAAQIGSDNGHVWQRPNTYLVSPKPAVHHAKGQRRKIRAAVNAICGQHSLLFKGEGAPVEVRNYVGRLPENIADRNSNEQYRLEQAALTKGLKRYQKAALSQAVDYLYLGRRGKQWRRFEAGYAGVGVWEAMLPATHPDYHEFPMTSSKLPYLREV